MNNSIDFIKIKKAFALHHNEANALSMSAYMRNQFKFYGIKADQRRKIYSQELKTTSCIDWNVIYDAWNDEYRESQYFALDYLLKFRKFLTYDDIKRLEVLARNKAFWDSIDVLDGIYGSIVLKDIESKAVMLEYSTDSDIWIRRVAIDHQLEYKQYTDTELLSKIIINNLDSKEFFINKAIGWSLREYSKTNVKWVVRFLNKYQAYLSPLSIREASRYIAN